ncbi:MAG: hypothetical protein M3164_06200 [Actinomycetota bacterium]|nr:hypothetical protein [Actinomycetota bacterium]
MRNRRSHPSAVAGVLLVLLASAVLSQASAQPANGNIADYVEVTGFIDPSVARSLRSQVEGAARRGAAAIIVRVDTPGALGATARQVVDAVATSSVPVVVWVGPGEATAGGAGALLALSAGYTAMSPSARLGPLEPIDLRAYRTGADQRASTPDPLALLPPEEDWLGADARSALTSGPVEASEAARLRIIDATADSMPALLQSLKGKTVRAHGGERTLPDTPFTLRFMKMGLLERLTHSAARPTIAYLLLLLGVFGLLFEVYNPGIGASGLAGGVALMFGFHALTVLPTSWTGVALMIGGIALLVADLRANRLGAVTVLGFVTLAAGSVLLFARAHPSLRLPWWAIAMGLAANAIFFLSVMTSALKARAAKPLIGTEGLVGSMGVARTDISPEGQVMAKGTLWRAQTLGAAIGRGTPIKVKGIKGLTLMVEPSDEPAEETTG